MDVAERFRDLPGPRPARERAARAGTPAGPTSPPIRSRSSRRRPRAPTRSRTPAGCSAGCATRSRSRDPDARRRSSAGSPGSSATTSAAGSSGCRRSPSPTRSCRSCAWRSTTGSSPGIAATVGRGSAAGRSTSASSRLDDRLAEVRERARRRRRRQARAGATRATALELRSGLDRAAYEAGVESIRDVDRRRRDLPGEPRRAGSRRRSAATRGRCTGGSGPAIRRCSPRSSTSGASPLTGAPRAIVSASPEPFLSVVAGRRGRDEPDQGHAPARPRPRGRSRASPASSSPRRRTAPRT